MRRHYEHTFASVAPEWRRLGAIDKARNVLSLCGSYDFANVVEIGAGDGAILEQLSRHGFAHSYTALEISKSAVDAIRGSQYWRLEGSRPIRRLLDPIRRRSI